MKQECNETALMLQIQISEVSADLRSPLRRPSIFFFSIISSISGVRMRSQHEANRPARSMFVFWVNLIVPAGLQQAVFTLIIPTLIIV